MSELERLKAELSQRVEEAQDLQAIEALRVEALGKKGLITQQMKSLGQLDPDARRERGQALNRLKDEIAEALEEDAPEVIMLLHRCVQAIGEATSRQLLVQTWQVEASGGLLTTDGTNRRRTPGGVFFWLVKQKASSEDRQRIFSRA